MGIIIGHVGGMEGPRWTRGVMTASWRRLGTILNCLIIIKGVECGLLTVTVGGKAQTGDSLRNAAKISQANNIIWGALHDEYRLHIGPIETSSLTKLAWVMSLSCIIIKQRMRHQVEN